MRLLEHFESSGNFLFRWRSYLPLITVTAFIVNIIINTQPYIGPHLKKVFMADSWSIFSISVSFFGLAVRIFTIGYTPEGTSGRNTSEQIAESLNTTGTYSVMRNPLYFGNFFMWLGLAIFTESLTNVMLSTLVYWLYYERIIFAEERFLTRKFGDKYIQWSAMTPAFFPTFKRYIKPPLSFSSKNILKREYNGFFAVIVLFLFFDLIKSFSDNTSDYLDRSHVIFFCIGFSIWTILKFLKKHTRILSVEGR